LAVNIFMTYVVMLFVVLARVPGPALEPLALYDDFNGTRLDPQPALVFPYALSDVAPPGRPGKRLDASIDVPSCTTTPRPDALIQAFIDRVFVNQSAALSR
jgi:hypothetical protein